MLAIAAAAAGLLHVMGRPPICTCGYVELWHGAVDAGNSQHLLDWYSASHIIHGFLFYAVARWFFASRPLGPRLIAATIVEATWEVVENTPLVIDRYRAATIALGYTGDSIVNSLADIGCMIIGFLLAARLPVVVTIGLALFLELLAALVVRDGLALNILMLLHPIGAVRAWQAGG